VRAGGIIRFVAEKPVIDYVSSKSDPLSEAEQRAFVLLLPAAIGVMVGGLCAVIGYLLTLW
jgi:hypothetical protein